MWVVVGLVRHFWKQQISVPLVPAWQQLLPQQISAPGQVMQLPLTQVCVPSGHRQLPPEQVLPPVHVTPHAPQLLFVFRYTHAPPQAVWPLGQTHLPLKQVAPLGQTLPQVPQLAGSVWVLTQTKPQAFWPEGQTTTHWPFWQVFVLSQ